MVIMFSGPWPRISLISAEPPAVMRKLTSTGWPCWFFPAQLPSICFNRSNDLCASDSAIAKLAQKTMTRVAMPIAMLRSFIDSSGDLFCFPGSLQQDFARLAGVLLFNESFQVAEIHLPELAVSFKPRSRGCKRRGVQPVNAVPSAAGFDDQPRFAQLSQVLGNRRT